MSGEELLNLLKGAQAYVSEHCALLLTEAEERERIYPVIEHYVFSNYTGLEDKKVLAERIYEEMAEFSILSPYLKREDVEEIDVNSWKDIMVQFSDGRREKLSEGFLSKGTSLDIVKRLLRESGTVMDFTKPVAEGSLSDNKRIVAIQSPVLDEEMGVSCSIRLLHSSKRTLADLTTNQTITPSQKDFLLNCFENRRSFVVAGSTDAGKTTLLSALLHELSSDIRLFVIESGTREFSLRHEEKGHVTTNIVQTLSYQEAPGNISQEKLVETALRFNPDIIVIGEMRDVEAYAAVEAAGSGHMVVSTVHASSARGAITRIAMLSKKRYQMDFQTAYQQAAIAFPIVVIIAKDKEKKRRVEGIFEVRVNDLGEVHYESVD